MDTIRLLIVDDEDDFRQATAQVLSRRGFTVTEAPNGETALGEIEAEPPDVVLLDLRMPGMDGLTTLEEIRKLEADLPVVILTGHGRFDDALVGIDLKIVDFVQKPVDVEQLAERIRRLLEHDNGRPLREKTIAELMVPTTTYHRIYADESLSSALDALRDSLFQIVAGKVTERGHCSVLVFDRADRFVGMLRVHDIIRAVLPVFLGSSPYLTYFTGMFLAQTKVMSRRQVLDVMNDQPTISVDAPLMEAVHAMVAHNVVNLPVMRGDEIVGVLRDRDILIEITRSVVG